MTQGTRSRPRPEGPGPPAEPDHPPTTVSHHRRQAHRRPGAPDLGTDPRAPTAHRTRFTSRTSHNTEPTPARGPTAYRHSHRPAGHRTATGGHLGRRARRRPGLPYSACTPTKPRHHPGPSAPRHRPGAHRITHPAAGSGHPGPQARRRPRAPDPGAGPKVHLPTGSPTHRRWPP